MYQSRDVSDVAQTGPDLGAYGHPVAKLNPRGEAFAALLRDARKGLDLTQDEVVERSGVSRSTYLRWEGGDASRMDPDKVRAVLEVLRIDPRRAAVALGYLDPVHLNPPDQPREPLPQDLEEVVQILQDPRIPSVAKDALMGYLRQLRHQSADQPARGSRRAG